MQRVVTYRLGSRAAHRLIRSGNLPIAQLDKTLYFALDVDAGHSLGPAGVQAEATEAIAAVPGVPAPHPDVVWRHLERYYVWVSAVLWIGFWVTFLSATVFGTLATFASFAFGVPAVIFGAYALRAHGHAERYEAEAAEKSEQSEANGSTTAYSEWRWRTGPTIIREPKHDRNRAEPPSA